MKLCSLFTLCILVVSCGNSKKEKETKPLFQFIHRNQEYALDFYEDNTVVLHSLAGTIKDKRVTIQAGDRNKLDSFMHLLQTKRQTDTVFFPSNLNTGKPYTLSFPLDTTLNTTFRMYDNQPRIVYDFLNWLETVKLQLFNYTKP